MRTLTYYMAISADGFIAHQDGSVEGFAKLITQNSALVGVPRCPPTPTT